MKAIRTFLASLVMVLFSATAWADVEYLIYSDGMPADAVITIGNQTFRGLNPEGVTFSVAKELKAADIVVTVGGGYVYVLGLDNANHQIRVNFPSLFEPTASVDADERHEYLLRDGSQRFPYIISGNIWHTTNRKQASHFIFVEDEKAVGTYYIYDVTKKVYYYYVATTNGNSVSKTTESNVRYSATKPSQKGTWRFTGDGHIIPATGSTSGWNFTGGNNHVLNLWSIDDSNSFWDVVDPTAGTLACATTMYALPGAEYIHKLLPAEGEQISGVTFGDGLTGLRFCTDRQEVGNKYVYVAGTAPTTEGVYTYDVLLAGGTHATVTLTVSAYLAAPTPLMGWLSWNWFESWAEQGVLVANAKAMKERGLVDAGWRYFILDDKWAVKGATKERLTFDTAKFPAMTGEGGFNTIMHGLGFRTGIYSDAGSTTCAGWQAGSYGYETQHLALFDAWGFDMLKYDFCNNQAAAQASYKPMGDAIRALNVQRQKDGKVPFAFNICEWGQNEPWKWGAEVGGNSWRCTYDSRECWMGNGGRVGVVDGTDLVKNLWMYAGVNRFNDADMMMIGLHGCGSSSNNIPGHTVNGGGNLPSPFTAVQARSQMSVWSMLASPLTICADFRDKPESRDNASATLPNPLITADDMATLTNKDIIGINQDLLGQQAEYMKALSTGSGTTGYDIFVKDLSGGRRAVAVFNRSAAAVSSLSFRLADAYLSATETYFVKDIWAGTVRQVTDHFTTGALLPYETKVFLIGTEQMEGTLIDEDDEVTLTYSYRWNGVEKGTESFIVPVGSPFPLPTTLPDGVVGSLPEGNVSAGDTVAVECHLADTFPVALVDDPENVPAECCYILEQNPNDKSRGDGFWTYVKGGNPNVTAPTGAAPTFDDLDAKSWFFGGNPFDGIVIYNKAAGPKFTLNRNATPYVLKQLSTNNTWKIVGSDRSAFFIQPANNATRYINLQGATLKYYSQADGGSTVKATPATEWAIRGGEYASVNGGARPDGISDLSLWYDAPATKSKVADKWMEFGLGIGNGQLGAVLLGGVLNDEIQFNEKTLWEGSANSDNQGYYQNFGFLTVGDQSGAFASTPVDDYARYLDIERGVAGVTYRSSDTHYERTYVASAPDGVIAAHYTANGQQRLQLLIAFLPDDNIKASKVTYADGEGTFSGRLTTVSYDARFRVVSDGTVTTGATGISVSNATHATIYLAARTNYDGTTATLTGPTAAAIAAANVSAVANAAQKGWDALYADHVSNFAALMNRVALDLNGANSRKDTKTLVDLYAKADNRTTDDGLFLEKLYYQYGRYLTIASNNTPAIAVPSNLQGIWNTYSNSSFWHCDIHADINVEMNYWPVEAANLGEMHTPFLDYIINNSDDSHYWHKLAQKYHPGVPGWMISTENNIFGGVSNWQTDDMKTHNGWYCQHLWQHYLYTQDLDFLRRAFPAMYGAAQFLMAISTTDKDGSLVIPNEWSPEHGPYKTITAYAQQITAECIRECIEAAALLGADSGLTDADMDALNAYYAQMDRGLNTETYGGKTCLKEWKYYGLNQAGDASSHRHMSHLMALYPFNQVSPFDDANADLYNAAKNALYARSSTDVTGWSMGWRTNLYARVLDAEKAHQMINLALHHSTQYNIQMSNYGGMYYNLWDAHSPFQIDGNFGVTAGINEMLLQSYDGTLHVLPALPSAWPNGSVKGLKAVGNFTVDVVWAAGKAAAVTIRAGSHHPLTVSIPDTDLTEAVVLVNGEPADIQPDGDTYRLDTKPGDTVAIQIRDITAIHWATHDGGYADAASPVSTLRSPLYDLSGRRLTRPLDGAITIAQGTKRLTH